MEELLTRSGMKMHVLAIAGVRSPSNIGYKGSWLGALILTYSYFSDLMMTLGLLTIGAHFISPGVSLIERSVSAFPTMCVSLVQFRIIYYFINRNRFTKLLKSYANAMKADPYPSHLQEEFEKGSKIIGPFHKILIILMVAPMIAWSLVPVMNEFSGKPRKLVVPALFPFDPLKSNVGFIATTFLQITGALYTPLKIIAFDMIFYSYAMIQRAIINHVSYNFSRIFDCYEVSKNGIITYFTYEGKPSNKNTVEIEMIAKYRIWTIHDQECLRLLRELQSLFSPWFFVQFSLQTMILCTSALTAATSDVDLFQAIFSAIYVLGNMSELFFTCRIGDYIYSSSQQLTNGCIGKDFYLGSKQKLQYLRLILTSSQIPLRLSAFGVFPLNTDTFRSIVVSTYSYFTLLTKLK